MAKADPTKKIAKIEQTNESLEETARYIANAGDDDTRQKIAKKFINYYFGIMILIIVGVPAYNFAMYNDNKPTVYVSIREAILTYSAVAGPTFGLVVAYYFKEKNK